MEQQYLAHSSQDGPGQPIKEHLRNVAELAAEFAKAFGADEEAYLAGILHDLGKYGDLFQKRLRGEASGVDHWSLGAWSAFADYKAVAAGMAIWGHHIGLQQMGSESIKGLEPTRLVQQHPLNLQLSEPSLEVLKNRLQSDGLSVRQPSNMLYQPQLDSLAQMLDVRMLFSALVDADFLDTARHFGEERPQGPPLESGKAFEVLQAKVEELASAGSSSPEVQQMRDILWNDCIRAGDEPQGIFTLTAPTGAGKTLAMLGFALKHAQKHNLRRIVVVIPYLSIIEQTAQVYRDLFRNFPPGYIIEHHSLTGTRAPLSRGNDEQDEYARLQRYLSENWDAPMVITTSVQMLESLFANTSSACRKLHRLAQSVILFDEVQTLPLNLAIPTLQALSTLACRYRATVVFATATQPAFTHLHRQVQLSGNLGWQPREIVQDVPKLFGLGKRVQVLRRDSQPISWQELARELQKHKQALCVVNIKRHAKELALLLWKNGENGHVFHLSTNMCPAHRQAVLDEVRRRLAQGEPCLLISTQCIEAGVDVDFPIVYRAFAPLDSIAQSAGRCNRHGIRQTGEVILFVPEEEKYPPGAYQQAAGVTRVHLSTHSIDLYETGLYDSYYRTLYDITKPEVLNQNLQHSIIAKDFPEVARQYRLIPDATINVLVPYDMEEYNTLANEARTYGLTGGWIRRGRPLVVGIYRPHPSDTIMGFLEPIPIRGKPSGDWFIYTEPSHYHCLLGLNPQDVPDNWIL
ncbi:MAG: CRISPR-associated helicase Cas3' [Armatimonadota bacterium]